MIGKSSPYRRKRVSKISSLMGIESPVGLRYKSDEPPPRRNPLLFKDQLYGLEFEIENAARMPESIYEVFFFDEDGSLRNDGRELKLCARGDDLFKCMELYFEELPESVSFSDRTSIHVHLDMTQRTSEEVICTVLLSILFEDMLYEFAGNHRRGNIFCLQLAKTHFPRIINSTLKQNVSLDTQLKNLIGKWHKYLGTNISSLRSFGTIEYRHMYGHRNPDKFYTWLNILGSISNWSIGKKMEDVVSTVFGLNSNSRYDVFGVEVFGAELWAKFKGTNSPQSMMEDGVITVKLAFSDYAKIAELGKKLEPTSSLAKMFPPSFFKTKKLARFADEVYSVGLIRDYLNGQPFVVPEIRFLLNQDHLNFPKKSREWMNSLDENNQVSPGRFVNPDSPDDLRKYYVPGNGKTSHIVHINVISGKWMKVSILSQVARNMHTANDLSSYLLATLDASGAQDEYGMDLNVVEYIKASSFVLSIFGQNRLVCIMPDEPHVLYLVDHLSDLGVDWLSAITPQLHRRQELPDGHAAWRRLDPNEYLHDHIRNVQVFAQRMPDGFLQRNEEEDN